MFDEMKRLREDQRLLQLLENYVQAAANNLEIWLDRQMQLPNASTVELTLLHGELLAYGWIEQNTGNVPVLRMGDCPGCYRITAAGRRAVKRSHQQYDLDDDSESLAA